MASSKRLRAAASITAGLLTGLVLAECAFSARDEGAFPHLNLYVADDELGVRLVPGTSMRFRTRKNPVTEIAIHDGGYRAPAWPAPGANEILVVGDSQVFGLGVDAHQTFSAALGRLTGRTVLNAGVPTYGPLEYSAVVKEVMQARGPGHITTVIYVVNLANDLFETSRPNRDRHAVWDGWAVRKETAPDDVTGFPGRAWLYGRSHAFYALRRFLYAPGTHLEVRLPSEGSFEDLVALTDHHQKEERSAAAAAEKATAERLARQEEIRVSLARAREELRAKAREVFPDERRDDDVRAKANLIAAAYAQPGDIVAGNYYAEAASPIFATAEMIRDGVQLRARLERQAAQGRGPWKRLEGVAEQVRELEGQLVALTEAPFEAPRVPSVLEPQLQELQAYLAARGAELVVVALPLDVQVDPREWNKYGYADALPDMTGTEVFAEDLVKSARAIGARALDATLALRSGSPGSFLDGDLHMTPQGHGVVAVALARTLEEPPPPLGPLLPGRTRVPAPAAWRRTPEIVVRGSTAARCETLQIDEWIRVSCRRVARRDPTGVEVVSGAARDVMRVVTEDASTVVLALLPGGSAELRLFWKHETRPLTLSRGEDGAVTGQIGERVGEGRPLEVTPADRDLCLCHQVVTGERACQFVTDDYEPCDTPLCGSIQRGCQPACTELYGEASEACTKAAGTDCVELLRCARRAAPACPEDMVAVAEGECLPACVTDEDCEEGACRTFSQRADRDVRHVRRALARLGLRGGAELRAVDDPRAQVASARDLPPAELGHVRACAEAP